MSQYAPQQNYPYLITIDATRIINPDLIFPVQRRYQLVQVEASIAVAEDEPQVEILFQIPCKDSIGLPPEKVMGQAECID